MAAPVVLDVRQRTPEWLAARENGIGASQAAAAIGLDPWQSPMGLWAEKLGLVPPVAENVAMRIGGELEPLIARLYTEATGVKVRRANNLRQHRSHPFMLASIDRRAGRKPVELKYSARATGYGEPGTDEVPDQVLVQVLHQLAILDEDEADVALLRAGADAVAIYPIRRSAEAEATIVEREAIFWDHVQSRTEPPVDGSEATHRALNALYQRREDLIAVADAPTRGAMERLQVIRARLNELEKERAEREAEIKAYMLETGATVVQAAGVGEIPWRQPKESTSTAWKLVAAAYREAIERGEAAAMASSDCDVLEAIHTSTKENTPRFGPPKWVDQEESDV